MKKILLTIGVAALLAMGSRAESIFQTGFDAAITNGAVGGGYWRATTGNYSIASYDFLYNFTTQSNSLGAGLIVGGDYLWGSKKTPIWNDVKGGFAVSYKGNLSVIGFTNTTFKLVAGTAIANPHQASTGIGNITFASVDIPFRVYKRVELHVAPSWQTREGQGDFDRQYVGVQIFVSLNF